MNTDKKEAIRDKRKQTPCDGTSDEEMSEWISDEDEFRADLH